MKMKLLAILYQEKLNRGAHPYRRVNGKARPIKNPHCVESGQYTNGTAEKEDQNFFISLTSFFAITALPASDG